MQGPYFIAHFLLSIFRPQQAETLTLLHRVVQVFTNALLTLPAKMRGMGAIRRGAFEESEQKEFLGKIMYAKVRQAMNEHTAAPGNSDRFFCLSKPPDLASLRSNIL